MTRKSQFPDLPQEISVEFESFIRMSFIEVRQSEKKPFFELNEACMTQNWKQSSQFLELSEQRPDVK